MGSRLDDRGDVQFSWCRTLEGSSVVGARTVNQEATAALRPIIEGVCTQEELDDVLDDLRDLKSV